ESGTGCANAPYAMHFLLPMGASTIAPASPLPAISGCSNLLIDGTTQAGYAANSSIPDWNAAVPLELDGVSCSICSGLNPVATGTIIRGIRFKNWDRGINISATAHNVVVQGNEFLNNNEGIAHLGSNGVLIGGSGLSDRNLIGSSTSQGILSAAPAGPPVFIRNNAIGVGPSQSPLFNDIGIKVISGANHQILDNVIGLGNIGVFVDTFFAFSAQSAASAAQRLPSPEAAAAAASAPPTTGAAGGTKGRAERALPQKSGPPAPVLATGIPLGTPVFLATNKIYGNNIGIVVDRGGPVHYDANNSIFGNSNLGIDLNNDDATANDDLTPPYDTDSGPNQLLNFPRVLSVVPTSANTANINFEMKSTPSSNFEVCFCRNSAGGDQCEQQAACTSISTDANGLHTGSFALGSLSAGMGITMMARALTGPKIYGASEISPKVLFAAAGPVSFSVDPVVFASTPLNWTRTINLNIVNSSAAPVTFSGPAFSGAAEITGGFTNPQAVPACNSGTIPAMGQCQLAFSYTPTALGPSSATFNLTTSAGPVSLNLSGSGIATLPFPTGPAPINFAATAVGSSSAPLPAAFAVPAGGPALQFSTSGILGADAPDFNIASDGCNLQTISAGASCTVQVRFAPQATTGAKSASLLLFAFEPSGAYRSLLASLTGSAIAAGPAVTVTGTTTFPSTTVGSSSAVQAITITNSGTATLTISAISHSAPGVFPDTTSGPAPNIAHWCGFGSVAGGAPQTGAPINIAPGSSCVWNLVYTPSGTGPQSATITINSNAPGSPHTVTLSGNGVATTAPTLTAGFAPTSVGVSTNATLTLTLSNPNPSPAGISPGGAVTMPVGLNISGLVDNCGASAFINVSTVTTINLGMASSIPALGSCTITVQAQSATPG
ncbi:MAG TPA: choice-of-anchor D domain-containing protein, partial [Usitatibacteraceae bacterium]|nr:choice-of-anchor D domain-containing protein [Usitatibacteraceae bacterium]